MADESSIFEAAGTYGSGDPKGWIRVSEQAGGVNVDIRGFDVTMTPDQADRLATQLRRIARRRRAKNV